MPDATIDFLFKRVAGCEHALRELLETVERIVCMIDNEDDRSYAEGPLVMARTFLDAMDKMTKDLLAKAERAAGEEQ